MAKYKKQDRLSALSKLMETEPFLTDEELSERFSVSIQTIRLDRLTLNIPEVRERVKSVATGNYDKVKSLAMSEIVGELIDLELNVKAISMLDTDSSMVFEKTKVVKGHFIFSMAETLAMALIDAHVAIAGIANVKYITPVIEGQKLIAKAELSKVMTRNRGVEYIVHVKINVGQEQVFRGKFNLVKIS